MHCILHRLCFITCSQMGLAWQRSIDSEAEMQHYTKLPLAPKMVFKFGFVFLSSMCCRVSMLCYTGAAGAPSGNVTIWLRTPVTKHFEEVLIIYREQVIPHVYLRQPNFSRTIEETNTNNTKQTGISNWCKCNSTTSITCWRTAGYKATWMKRGLKGCR